MATGSGIQVGSCNIDELQFVGKGQPNPRDVLVFNSFMAAAGKGSAGTPIPAGQIISSLYRGLGIDPVGQPNVYSCPQDWEAIYVDRRTDWNFEKRMALIAVVLIAVLVFLNRK